jgi:hypothetical protein
MVYVVQEAPTAIYDTVFGRHDATRFIQLN